MSKGKYSTSFSVGGGFFYNESTLLAELIIELKNWQLVREQVEENNLLQARTIATSGRFFREVSSRLKELSEEELQVLVEGSHQEKNQIIWLAICKKHKFIRDFVVEVVREKYLNLNSDLSKTDYDIFYAAKAEWHEELDRLALSTRNKMKASVFKILRQAGIITDKNKIISTVLSPRVSKAIKDNSAEYMLVFPTTDA